MDLIERQAAIDVMAELQGRAYTKAELKGISKAWKRIKQLPSAQPEPCEYVVSAVAVEEMLKNLLPESGMWEIEGDDAKTAICETIHDALDGLWRLPFVKPDSKELSSTHKGLDTISRQAAIDEIRKDKIDSNSLKIMDALGNGNEALTVNMTCDRHIQSLKNLPSAQPTYTDAEIQKMQDIEQAQLEKAFELGREDAKAEASQRWIPCSSQRLPEEGERVLATHLGGVNPKNQVIEHIYQCGKFTCGWDMDMNVDSPTFGQRYMGEVIAWMPLPEPYREEGEWN